MKELEQIKARLSQITPGEWKLWGMSVMADPIGNSNVDDAYLIATTSDPHRGLRTWNANFIAKAPSDISRLVAAVEAVLSLIDEADTRGIASGSPLEADAIRAAIENALIP